MRDPFQASRSPPRDHLHTRLCDSSPTPLSSACRSTVRGSESSAFGGNTDIATPTDDVDTQGNFYDYWENWGPSDPNECAWNISPAKSTFTAVPTPGSSTVLADTTANMSIACSDGTLSGTTGDSPTSRPPALLASITGSSLRTCSAGLDDDTWSVAQTAGSTWSFYGDSIDPDGVTSGHINAISADVTGSVAGDPCQFHASITVPAGHAAY